MSFSMKFGNVANIDYYRKRYSRYENAIINFLFNVCFLLFRISQKKKGDSLVIVKRMSGRNYCPSVSHCTLRRQTATLKFMRRHVLFPVIRHSHTTRDNNNCFLFASSNNNNDDNLTGYCAKNLLQRVRIVSFSVLCAWLLPGRSLGRSPGLCRAISLGLVAWLTDWLPGWLAGWIHWQL